MSEHTWVFKHIQDKQSNIGIHRYLALKRPQEPVTNSTGQIVQKFPIYQVSLQDTFKVSK